MQLNELDKKSLIELKDEIADLERRVEEVSTISAKSSVPLEVLIEQSSFYKGVWDDTYYESKAQAKDLLGAKGKNARDLEGERLTYSPILESGKTYEQVGEGIIGLFALKIIDGGGLFDFMLPQLSRQLFTFTVIPGEKYVLLSKGVVSAREGEFEVKEIEGHIRYVLAMSAFLDPKIEEVI